MNTSLQALYLKTRGCCLMKTSYKWKCSDLWFRLCVKPAVKAALSCVKSTLTCSREFQITKQRFCAPWCSKRCFTSFSEKNERDAEHAETGQCYQCCPEHLLLPSHRRRRKGKAAATRFLFSKFRSVFLLGNNITHNRLILQSKNIQREEEAEQTWWQFGWLSMSGFIQVKKVCNRCTSSSFLVRASEDNSCFCSGNDWVFSSLSVSILKTFITPWAADGFSTASCRQGWLMTQIMTDHSFISFVFLLNFLSLRKKL